MRAVIWAGVSSRPQVEDRDSLPRQLQEGEQLCQRNGWQIVGRLQVPGASRNYVDLADAIEGLDDDLRRLRLDVPNAYRELANLIAGRQLDVLVVRSRDRLARTDSLIAGIEERLRRSGATLYSMAMPPTGQRAGDFYVSAVERASAQHEIERLRERNSKGMDDRFRRGLMNSGAVPFPYVETFAPRGNSLVRHAVPDPERVQAYLWAVHATLERTHSALEIGQRLNSNFPDQGFAPPKIRDILLNSVPVGLITRKRVIREGEDTAMVTYVPLDTPSWPEIESLLLHRAERAWSQSERKLKTPKMWLVTKGQHEPIIDPELWLELQRFIDVRSGGRRPPSRERLWSGLLWCGRCGAKMWAAWSRTWSSNKSFGVYVCSTRYVDRDACDNPSITEKVVTTQMLEFLENLVISLPPTTSEKGSKRDPLRDLERQRTNLEERRGRLVLLFETGRISLDDYDQRLADLQKEQVRVQAEINALAEQKVRETKKAKSLAELNLSQAKVILAGDSAAANRWLRNLLVKVWVDNRRITDVEL